MYGYETREPWKYSAKSLHERNNHLIARRKEIASFDRKTRRKISVRNVLHYISLFFPTPPRLNRLKRRRGPPPVPPTDIERNRDSVTDTIWNE